MKKYLSVFIVFYLFSGISVYAQFHYPSFKWENTEHDFGPIQHQNPVVYEFEFFNKGQAPLIISEVEGSCGCTVAEYTHEPVMPGQKGKVKATFDAAALGKFRKSIKVVANVEGGPEYLYVKGTVVQDSSPENPR
jgi:hypothetical protein